MSRIQSFELYQVDLPFKRPFRHSAKERDASESLFLKCRLESDVIGFGESLPREYVTGETRAGAYELLITKILPRLLGRRFDTLDEVKTFLSDCDGKAPYGWVDPDIPQSAAWCAVDLALLDAVGRESGAPVADASYSFVDSPLRCGAVLSQSSGMEAFQNAVKARLFGLKQWKVKVDLDHPIQAVRQLRRWAGRRTEIRLDANMAWNREEALAIMTEMAELGVSVVEQPLPADDIEGLSWLAQKNGFKIIADESVRDRKTLQALIHMQGCSGVNLRISKLGGLIATIARLREAHEAGLLIQLGCQVGESSLLSAAQLALISSSNTIPIEYLEGCFGKLLLTDDPVRPLLQFGWGGKPPEKPAGSGFGVEVDEFILLDHTSRHETIAESQGSEDV